MWLTAFRDRQYKYGWHVQAIIPDGSGAQAFNSRGRSSLVGFLRRMPRSGHFIKWWSFHFRLPTDSCSLLVAIREELYMYLTLLRLCSTNHRLAINFGCLLFYVWYPWSIFSSNNFFSPSGLDLVYTIIYIRTTSTRFGNSFPLRSRQTVDVYSIWKVCQLLWNLLSCVNKRNSLYLTLCCSIPQLEQWRRKDISVRIFHLVYWSNSFFQKIDYSIHFSFLHNYAWNKR